jgi:hypothetical protein
MEKTADLAENVALVHIMVVCCTSSPRIEHQGE